VLVISDPASMGDVSTLSPVPDSMAGGAQLYAADPLEKAPY